MFRVVLGAFLGVYFGGIFGVFFLLLFLGVLECFCCDLGLFFWVFLDVFGVSGCFLVFWGVFLVVCGCF